MSTTYLQRQAIEAFNHMRYKGFWNRVIRTLTGQPTTLPAFDQSAPHHHPHRQALGLRTVPLANIVGSLGRSQDFGPGFHPLRKSLQERWGQLFQLAREDRWEPVHLVKVGSQYFVEDGNHRVSIAHYLGRSYIDAEVWVRPVFPTLTLQGRCAHCGQLVAERA